MPLFDHHVVTALDPVEAETEPPKRANGLLAIDGGKIRRLANSDKPLQCRQPCWRKWDLPMVGFHRLDVTANHLNGSSRG
jgi:hypothetical protein